MTESKRLQEQKHPRYTIDRGIVDVLLKEKPSDYNLVELARLIIGYRGFPGAKDIQRDLLAILELWGYSEESLFEQTRQIHATDQVYRGNHGRYDYLQQKQIYPGDGLPEVI